LIDYFYRRIQLEILLYDAECSVLAIAEFIVCATAVSQAKCCCL